MSETKHTPGEWRVVKGHRFVSVYGGARKVARIYKDYQRDPASDYPNAHLIAAAPDYHAGVAEALKQNDGYNCDYVSIPVKAWRMILAAHAKAEGGR